MLYMPTYLRWPLGLIGMLALIFPIEVFFARHPERYLSPIETDWTLSGVEASGSMAKADVLCFGDSMVKFGVSPTIMKQALGRSVHSFALLDGKPAASYLLFRRTIESGARPKLVVVDFQPECLIETAPHQLKKRHWAMLLSPVESLKLFRVYGDSDFLGRTLIAGLLPSVRCRALIRDDVSLALGGIRNPNPLENAKTLRNRQVHAGGMLLPPRPGYAGEVDREAWVDLIKDNWFHRPEHTSYVRRFMALARNHGIPVVWVLPPNVPKVEQTRREIGLHDRFSTFVESIQSIYPNVHVVDARLTGFTPDVFVDAVHLDREGALALSLDVSEVAGTILDSGPERSRWVRLDPFRPRTSPAPLEDVARSWAIEQRDKKTIRR